MAIAGMALAIVSGLAMLVFSIQILVTAFKTSILWGLGSLFVPFVILIFVVMRWDETKKPFLYSLACLPAWFVGFLLMGMGGMVVPEP